MGTMLTRFLFLLIFLGNCNVLDCQTSDKIVFLKFSRNAFDAKEQSTTAATARTTTATVSRGPDGDDPRRAPAVHPQRPLMSSTFSYFAYGSNLLQRRIHIKNPSAVRLGLGRLDDYGLDFSSFSKRWKGAVATIIPAKGQHVWGAIWEIGIEHLKSLDQQEGVDKQIYYPMEVNVQDENGLVTNCRVYRMHNETEHFMNLEDLPKDRRPSPQYLKTIILGAQESRLPIEYQNMLQKIPDNGYSGKIEVDLEL